MKTNSSDRAPELHTEAWLEQFAAYLDGGLSSQELAHLDALLQESTEARALYLDFCIQATTLAEATRSTVAHSPSSRPLLRPPITWATPLALGLLLLCAAFFATDRAPSSPGGTMIALEHTHPAWEPGTASYAAWDQFDWYGLGPISPQTVSLLLAPSTTQLGGGVSELGLTQTWIVQSIHTQRHAQLSHLGFATLTDRFWSVAPQELDWQQFSFLQTEQPIEQPPL